MSKSKGRRLAEWLRNLDSNSKASTDTIADTSITFSKLHTALVVTETDAIGSNDNDTTIATSAAVKDYVDTQVAGKDALSELSGSTDDITEGSTNLYYTDARADARAALVVDSAPAALNTLNELAAALGDDANFSTTTATSLGNRLRIDVSNQGLTGAQKTNALTNLGITATVAELNYVDGVTSNIQTQLNAKGTSSFSGAYADLTGTPTIPTNNNQLTNGAGYITSFDITTQTDSKYLRSDTDDTTSGVLTTAQVRWGTGAGTYSGNPRSVVLGYSGGNYGQLGYGWVPTSTSGVHTSALSDIQTRIDLKDGIQVFSSNNTVVTSGNNVSWTELLDCRSSVLQYKNNNIWHAGNDGSGSGLDADLWDGNQFSSYLNQALLTTSQPTFSQINYTGALYAYESSNYIGSDPRWNQSGYNANEGVHHIYATTASAGQWGQTGLALYNGGAYVFLTTKSGDSNWYHNNNKMWSAGNDGSGSGLDADTVDGVQASGFMQLGTSSTSTVTQVFSTAAGQPMLWRDTNATNGTNCNIYSYWYAQNTTLGYIGYGSSGDSNLYLSNSSVGNVYLAASSGNGILANGSVMWHAGNDGAGSGLDADTLDGFNPNTGGATVILRTNSSGYLAHLNWINIANGTGFYCPNGAYFYNDTTYGWFARSSISSSGSVRLQTNNGTNRGWWYADSSYNQGFLTSAGGWGLKMDNSGNVTATGNVTAYSDLRLKEDIKPLENSLAKILQLRGVEYTRKDTGSQEIGVIAQELEEVLPEVVHISDATAEDDTEYTDIRSVDYGRMVSVLIEAMKEQQAQIEELKEIIKCQ